MIHWAIRWPEVFDISYWPMAVLYSVWIYNRVPKTNGIAPIELIVRSKNARHVLQQAHVFGCPCYVLDPKLQGLSKLPKFTPRSNRGVFVGFSPKHSSLVPLVLNLQTLTITPQFHVMFDDWYTTVDSSTTDQQLDDCLVNLFSSNRYEYQFDNDDINETVNELQKDTVIWADLLEASGGQLELSKCFYYVLSWKFDIEGNATHMTLEEINATSTPISPQDRVTRKEKIFIEQKEVKEAHKTLGAWKTMMGCENKQILELRIKSDKFAAINPLLQNHFDHARDHVTRTPPHAQGIWC